MGTRHLHKFYFYLYSYYLRCGLFGLLSTLTIFTKLNMNMLKIGSEFPTISLTDIENKTIIIPDEINTKYCILLFFRGAW
jgi:hypothetical protein